MDDNTLSQRQVDEALADLDQLCHDEYGYGINDLLDGDDTALGELRLQRLAGIVLKRNFATPVPIGANPSATGAHQAWQWNVEKFSDPRLIDTPEWELLDELRRDTSGTELNFSTFAGQTDSERGLFKVLALWLGDRLNQRDGRTFREYFEAQASPRMDAVLDLSTAVFQALLGPVLIPILPVPALAVSVALIGIQFGYRSMSKLPDQGDVGG